MSYVLIPDPFAITHHTNGQNLLCHNNVLPYYLQSLPFQLNAKGHATRSEIYFHWIFNEYAKKCICYNISKTE